MNSKSTKKTFKPLLALSALFLLCACAGPNEDDSSQGSSGGATSGFVPGENISIANAEGKYYITSVASASAELPIYAGKGKGDVPYADVKFAVDLLSNENIQGIAVNVSGKEATLTSSKVKDAKAVFDAAKNEIRLQRYSAIYGSEKTNNGFGYDYCLPKTLQAINASNKTKEAVAGTESVTIKLDDYGLKIYEQGGRVYAPLELLTLVTLSNSHYNFVFNGRDLYKAPVDFKSPALSASCYSGGDGFFYGYIADGYFSGSAYKRVDPKQGEKYRYSTVDTKGAPLDQGALVLYADGTAKMFDKYEGQEREWSRGGQIWRIAYEEQKDTIVLYVLEVMEGTGDDVKASKDNCSFTIRLNTGKTRYGMAERSQEMADYSYGLLCLNFDHFYGNKEFVTKGNFNQYLTEKNLKDRLKSKTVATYSEAMGEFLYKNVGDGHTAIAALSAYEVPNRVLMNSYIEKYQSQRVKDIFSRSNALMEKRFQGLGHAAGHTFTDVSGDTAMISFDQFVSDGMPSFFRNYENAESTQIIHQDSCGFMANAIMDLERYNADPERTTKIKNVVLDLACNGGGVMACMPYIAGIMTKDPTFNVKEVTSGKITEYHYECDFDGDGKFGDTYADKYDFYVLVSSASFSCATALPGMLKGTNVKIIGEKSAGGAAPVTFFTDGSGMAYQTSGNDIVCYKDGTEYKSVEEGVPVDHEIAEDIWYDLPKLGAKLNELKAK